MHLLRRKKFPVQAILRNGQHLTLYTNQELNFIAQLQGRGGIEYDIANDIVCMRSLPYNKADNKIMKVKLYGAINNGDIIPIFLNNAYYNLPVKGKIVIDIGANIGDSPIYFALCGAAKVIALEPFPTNYELARKNIESNNLSGKVDLLLAGCAASQGYITIDPNYKSNITSSLVESKHGIKVPLLTLYDILKKYNLLLSNETILKMDCEGCEYEAILSAPEDMLQKFSYIQIEYHNGYIPLKEKLEKSGFKVSFTRPMWNFRKQYMGYIYANQNKTSK
jgi:FkbM family methyltransferase